MRSFLRSLSVGLLSLCIATSAFAQGFNIPDGSSIQGHLRAGTQAGATPPVVVGGTVNAGSTDMVGVMTASAPSGSITFARTYTTAPFCIVWDQSATSTVSMPVYTVSATAITLTTIISTHVIGWMCIGQQSST